MFNVLYFYIFFIFFIQNAAEKKYVFTGYIPNAGMKEYSSQSVGGSHNKKYIYLQLIMVDNFRWLSFEENKQTYTGISSLISP